jgi:hypothetical protein
VANNFLIRRLHNHALLSVRHAHILKAQGGEELVSNFEELSSSFLGSIVALKGLVLSVNTEFQTQYHQMEVASKEFCCPPLSGHP